MVFGQEPYVPEFSSWRVVVFTQALTGSL